MRVCGATVGSSYSLLTCVLRITVDHLFQTILTRSVCIAYPYYTAWHCSPSHTVPDLQPCRRITASARPPHHATSHLRQICVCVCVCERERVEGIVIFLFHCFVLLNKINENVFFFFFLQLFSSATCTFWSHTPPTQQISTSSDILSFVSSSSAHSLFSSLLFSFPSLSFFVSLMFPFFIFI